MGNCCASKSDYTQSDVNTLIKIQSAYRAYLAKKQLKENRDTKIKQLFSKIFGIVIIFIDVQQNDNKSTQHSSLNGTQTVNVISQRNQRENVPSFRLSQQEIQTQDEVPRVYIDEYKDVGDGRLYKGQWNKKTGDRDGVGIQFWPDGSKYEGMWRQDRQHGKGRMTHSNGDIYEGTWKDDKANGFGWFLDTNNARYEGEWVEDQQHGFGVETWDSGTAKYSGMFYKGKKNGKGKFEWEDGSYYEGDFVDGQFQGYGKYYFADLDKVYEGEFRLSNMEGKGTEIWSDGKRYEGDFKGGKKDGQGTFEWPNGNKYIGCWINGKQHGFGIWINGKDGTKRQGEWAAGKRQKWITGPTEPIAGHNKGAGSPVK